MGRLTFILTVEKNTFNYKRNSKSKIYFKLQSLLPPTSNTHENRSWKFHLVLIKEIQNTVSR